MCQPYKTIALLPRLTPGSRDSSCLWLCVSRRVSWTVELLVRQPVPGLSQYRTGTLRDTAGAANSSSAPSPRASRSCSFTCCSVRMCHACPHPHLHESGEGYPGARGAPFVPVRAQPSPMLPKELLHRSREDLDAVIVADGLQAARVLGQAAEGDRGVLAARPGGCGRLCEERATTGSAARRGSAPPARTAEAESAALPCNSQESVNGSAA